ncbi:hypothetical protein AB0L06_28170 [Spirillospora sp. NPDC052269]
MAAFDTPRTGDRAAESLPSDPNFADLVAFTEAIEAAMKTRAADKPRLVTSGPWPRKEPGFRSEHEVRVWRADKGGPRVRVTISRAHGGGRWWSTIPAVPAWQEPQSLVRRCKVGDDLADFIEALLAECAPLGRI